MQSQSIQTDVRVKPLIDNITQWRRDIHMNPELSFDVPRTASLVAQKLREFGADEVVEGIGRTGVVGVIKGNAQQSGKCIGLRADMDALPIVETTQLAYASKESGKMHACGHDGHTAMLLGASQILCESRQFDGAVAVIFQPAEEFGAGGLEMVKDGMMERFNIQKVYGMHNLPNLPVGYFGVRPGPIMAAVDTFNVTIEGKGGHAAMPHLCVDTLTVAAQIITAIQHVASRQVDPLDSIVVSVTSLLSDSDAYNVIPQTVTLKGTVRTLQPHVQSAAELQLNRVITKTAEALGASAEMEYIRDYPSTINDAAESQFTAEVARAVVGQDQVDDDFPPLMGGEDFSFMLNERPGAFIFIGNGESASLHHPNYNFNDDAIDYGCSYWLKLVETAMPLNP